jgi:multicomponent Na+:H+ antiporter subunit A
MEQIIPYLIGAIILSGISIPLFYKPLKKYIGWLLAIVPFTLFIVVLLLFLKLPNDQSILPTASYPFLPGLNVSFRIDGLSIIFGLLISGIGFLVVLYASYYMSKYERQAHFFAYLMVFMGAMTGLVFSDNLIGLFIFWELTSVSSFLLIGFDHHLSKSRQAALQSLLITGFGGLCLLFAVILIGNITGTYSISEMIAGGIHLGNDPKYFMVFTLVLISVLTKSAQFPFHFWLPGAMQAPTPVSAYLHSATMVNAGVFLLLRLHPMIGETEIWKYSYMLAGGITMFLGAFFSMGQRDFKRILAFTTISALGTMILLIGIDTPQSLKAALVFFIVHGLYKGALFMIAGIIDKGTGTRDIFILSRIGKVMPVVSIAAFLALVSMAGLPPMLGFVGKELIYDAKIQLPGLWSSILLLGVSANILMVSISLSVFTEVFWPKSQKPAIKIKHPEKDFPWYFIAGPVVLSLAGLILGLSPGILDKPIENALLFSHGHPVEVHLSLWHGFNKVLIVSLFTVLAGVGIFLLRNKINHYISALINWFDHFHLPTAFSRMITNYVSIAGNQTKWIQHGYHRFYLITFFIATAILVSIQLFSMNDGFIFTEEYSPLRVHIIVLLFISALALFFAVNTSSRLTAILAMGVVGYGVGMIYLFYGAIDLAITQFLAETIVMIIFVMVIFYLPRFAVLSNRKSRMRDALISILIGTLVTLVVLKARFVNFFPPISDFFTENSYSLGHGKNIVNVILVDFRALDTLGEVTVLTLAAAGVYALFKFRAGKNKNDNEIKTKTE